jgi:FtsH-binding integral membrane protein
MNQNNLFGQETVYPGSAEAKTLEAFDATESKAYMTKVFMWMFGALALSGVFAVLFATNLELLRYLLKADGRGLNTLGMITMFAPLIFVFIMSLGYNRLSAPAMTALFILYSAINGISFSFILLAYQLGSVIGCFFSAAAMFGVMAVMGYTTKRDLTNFGSLMIMGLFGVLIASLINFFLKSSGLDYIISFVGVAVFVGLTAYDVQKLKFIGSGLASQGRDSKSKLVIMGALTLYLDFINIFLFLLRLFGRRK